MRNLTSSPEKMAKKNTDDHSTESCNVWLIIVFRLLAFVFLVRKYSLIFSPFIGTY